MAIQLTEQMQAYSIHRPIYPVRPTLHIGDEENQREILGKAREKAMLTVNLHEKAI
jgi:hypothetical protein